MAELEGAGLRPFTDSPQDVDALKTANKLLRQDRLNSAEVDELYRRVQATPDFYYSQQRLKDWRDVMDTLTGDKGSGHKLFASVLKRLIQRFLKSPATTERGLGLLASLARVSGHIGMNLVDVYRKLAATFGFKLIVTPGAERFAGASRVPHNTFVVGVTDDQTIRVRLLSEQQGSGPKSLQSLAHDSVRSQLGYLDRLEKIRDKGFLGRDTQQRIMYAQSGQYDDDPGDSVILDTLEKLGLPRIWGLSSYVNSLGHRPVTNSDVAAIDAAYKSAMDQYIESTGLRQARDYLAGRDLHQTGSGMTLQSLLNQAYAPMKAPRRNAAPLSHRGASAGQTSYALSGRPPPLPGTHGMSDGTIMRD